MELSARSLGWLRGLDRAVDSLAVDSLAADPWALWWSGVAVALMSRATPAWTEPHLRLLRRLADRCPNDDGLALVVHAALRGLQGMVQGHDEPARGEEPGRSDEPSSAPADAVAAAWPQLAASEPEPVIALAGLALWLSDVRCGTTLHRDVVSRWAAEQDHSWSTGPDGVLSATLLAPQFPDRARALFLASVENVVENVTKAPAAPAVMANVCAWFSARHWADDRLADRLDAALQHTFAPFWDEGDGSYHWGSASPTVDALLAAVHATQPGLWAEVTTKPSQPQPQVVGIDFPAVALRRAEWSKGFLTISLDPLQEDRKARTTFRLVGTEPRVWWISGLDNVTTDMATGGVTVRAPLVGATLEFAPSSY